MHVPRTSLLLASTLITFSCAHILSPKQKCDTFTHHHRTSLTHHNAQFLNSTYHPTKSFNISSTFNEIPFCEVFGSIAYPANNTLTFTLWLPDDAHYASRFLAVGNGGMAGVIDTTTMLAQLNSGLGLAIAGGDAGHLASLNNNGGGAPGVYLPYLHNPNQVEAWIHNAIALFTPAAKAAIDAFYGKGREVKRSYYYGCSTGGAQGFALVERWPELFDGIFAGSPGNWYSHLALSFLWNAQHTNTTATNLTQAELNFTTNAVLDACDEIDGVKDRVIENPSQCRFDIDSLSCESPQQSRSSSTSRITCLNPSKISAMKAIYAGPKHSDNGKEIYPGFDLGSEIEWILQEGNLANAFSIPILQNLVFDDLSYNSDTFNYASDVDTVNAKAGTHIDEISTHLTPFRRRGGKLLVSQGWADPYNAATWPIQHLDDVAASLGGDVSDFYRLFMVPGGGHCGAASFYPQVPATYHVLPKLIEWVERGNAPASVLSSDPPDRSGRTRKLCQWPRTARFCGGDVDDAGSYECV